MDPSKYMSVINDIEEKFPVNEWVVYDVHIWPRIRQILAEGLQNVDRDDVLATKKSSSLLHRIKRAFGCFAGFNKYISAFIKDYQHNDSTNKLADVVFYKQSNRRIRIGLQCYDKYCDPIIEILNEHKLKSLVLECAPKYEYLIPRHGKSVFIQPWIDYLIIKSRFLCVNDDAKNIYLDRYDEFMEFLESQNYNIKIPYRPLVIRYAKEIRTMANFFKKILRQSNPAVAFVQCYAGADGMAFMLACRELGIPSVDIQQGWQGDACFAYGRWNSVPEKGYEVLPTFFWVWGQEEEEAILRWNAKCSNYHKPIVAGDLWVDLWKKGDSKLVNDYDHKILSLTRKNEDTRNILVTMQNGYALPEFFFEALKKAPPNWYWWIRLHPAMMDEREQVKEMFKAYGVKNVEIDNASDLPLLAWLRHIDVHVTKFSSTILEAEAFNVPTVLIDAIGVDCYPKQMADGVAVSAYTAEEMLLAIDRHSEKKADLKRTEISEKGRNAVELLLSQARR